MGGKIVVKFLLMKKMGEETKDILVTDTQKIDIEIEKYKSIIKDIDLHMENYIKHKINFNSVSIPTITNYKSGFKYLKFFIKDSKTDRLNFKFFRELLEDFSILPIGLFI
jgi:hypothetical protein